MFRSKAHTMLSNALFLARRDELVNVDRALLRGCGIRQNRFISSGRKGLAFLLHLSEEKRFASREFSPRVDLIVCDMHLEDMTGIEFLRELRTLPAFADTPALLLACALPGAAVSELGRMGRVGILCRPYTQADLGKTLEFLCAEHVAGPMLTASPLAMRAMEHIRRPAVPAMKKNALALGIDLLQEGALESAQNAFKEAVRIKPYRAAAFRGLALVASELGNSARASRLMRAAARAFIMDEDFFNARRSLAQARAMEQNQDLSSPDTPGTPVNPLYKAGCSLVREGRYEPAARAILNGMAYTPGISPVTALKRACAATENEYHAAESLCAQMEACGGPNAAAALRRILTPPPLEEKPSRIGFLSDMFAVARQTYKMYRANAL